MLTLGITDGSDDLGAAMPRAPSAPIVNRIGKRSGRRPIENHHCPSTLMSFLTVSVPGPDGIRVARAGQPLNFRRSAEPHYAGDPQPQGQVPRELSAVRPLGVARGGSKLVRLEFRGLIHADGCAGSAAARAAYEALISPRGVVQVEC